MTINVYRDDVKIGTATGTPLPNAETGTLLEVNHPGGVCWGGATTPDLLPGDRVEVLTDDTGDAATTGRRVLARPQRHGEAGGDHDPRRRRRPQRPGHPGTAADFAGNRIAPALEGQVEQRIVAPDLKETSVGRRDLRALFTGGIADGVATTGDIAWDDTDRRLDRPALHLDLPRPALSTSSASPRPARPA